MDKKIFIGLAMAVFLIVSMLLIALSVSVLVNHAGTVGFLAAPFLAIVFAYIVYVIQAKLYNRYLKTK